MSQIFTPDRKHAAVCGLYCASCGVYIATQENNVQELQRMADSMKQTVEELKCDGCGAERKSVWCKIYCTFTQCAKEHKVEFCGSCSEYPCESLKDFQKKMPHRIELWKSQERIKDAGWEQWAKEMNDHFSCPACGIINSAYHLSCHKCGNTPGNQYTVLHKNEVENFFKK
ncbi:MAG: DUF3795 domain-containing protein [Bacteroidota bacterium]